MVYINTNDGVLVAVYMQCQFCVTRLSAAFNAAAPTHEKYEITSNNVEILCGKYIIL